jgi:hypothetical protein
MARSTLPVLGLLRAGRVRAGHVRGMVLCQPSQRLEIRKNGLCQILLFHYLCLLAVMSKQLLRIILVRSHARASVLSKRQLRDCRDASKRYLYGVTRLMIPIREVRPGDSLTNVDMALHNRDIWPLQ